MTSKTCSDDCVVLLCCTCERLRSAILTSRCKSIRGQRAEVSPETLARWVFMVDLCMCGHEPRLQGQLDSFPQI